MRPSARCAPRAVRLNCEVLEERVTPAIAYALSVTGPQLLSFDTANPTVTTTIGITGVTAPILVICRRGPRAGSSAQLVLARIATTASEPQDLLMGFTILVLLAGRSNCLPIASQTSGRFRPQE